MSLKRACGQMEVITEIYATCDLSDEAPTSSHILFTVELSDPDIHLVWLVPAVVVIELEALDVACPVETHPLGLQDGGVSLPPHHCAGMHEVTWALIYKVVGKWCHGRVRAEQVRCIDEV